MIEEKRTIFLLVMTLPLEENKIFTTGFIVIVKHAYLKREESNKKVADKKNTLLELKIWRYRIINNQPSEGQNKIDLALPSKLRIPNFEFKSSKSCIENGMHFKNCINTLYTQYYCYDIFTLPRTMYLTFKLIFLFIFLGFSF